MGAEGVQKRLLGKNHVRTLNQMNGIHLFIFFPSTHTFAYIKGMCQVQYKLSTINYIYNVNYHENNFNLFLVHVQGPGSEP